MRIGYDAKRVFHNASGLGNYGRDLVRILATHLHKNEFYLYNPKKARVARWKPLPNTTEKNPLGIWRYISALWRQGPISKQLKADGIELFHGLSGELPKGIQMPSIVTVHDLIFLRYPKLYHPVDVYIHKRKVNHAVKVATRVVAISEQTKKDLIQFTGIPENNITVIYQGCHQAFKTKLPEKIRHEIKTKFGLPEKYVLYVGTLEPRKNALSIAEALKNTDHHMVFVGKSKAYGEKLKAFVTQNKMDDRAIFIENISVEELAGVYQNATVFCYPSFFEGFGIPIIEALYSGVPVVTSKGGCFAEAGGSSSLYIDPTNHNEIGKSINLLFSEPKVAREERIKEGLSYVQRFNDKFLAIQWEELYKSTIDE